MKGWKSIITHLIPFIFHYDKYLLSLFYSDMVNYIIKSYKSQVLLSTHKKRYNSSNEICVKKQLLLTVKYDIILGVTKGVRL